MNANLMIGEGWVKVSGGRLKGMKIDARNIPDLVPVCAVLGCFAEGETNIYNAERLRIKESDRLASISSELKKMGARITAHDGGLTVVGPSELRGATVDSHGDHRIAMACAVAALAAKGETKILRAECISKSYPEFFDDLKSLGAKLIVR
jgi:3-phosphoshikimate 1-carboxyvinyltransferase